MISAFVICMQQSEIFSCQGPFEPVYGILVLMAYGAPGLILTCTLIYTPTFCLQALMAQARLCIRAGLPDHVLLAYVISAKISFEVYIYIPKIFPCVENIQMFMGAECDRKIRCFQQQFRLVLGGFKPI